MALGFNFNPSNISLLKNTRERKRKFRSFKDARMFPRGNFPEESFPVGSFPEGKFPRRSVSQKVSFPEGKFPRRKFPIR